MRLWEKMCVLFLLALPSAAMIIGCGTIISVTPDGQIIIDLEYEGIVPIQTVRGAGSGVVIGEDKQHYYIGTAAHVLDNGAGLPVSAPRVDGVVGEVVAYGDSESANDVAIVKIPKGSRRYKVYQFAVAKQEDRVRGVGFVYENGLDKPTFVVYHGRIVTLDWRGFIAYNGGIFPGCSGGPLLDTRGRIIGICSRSPFAWGVPFETAALFVLGATLQEMLAEVL